MKKIFSMICGFALLAGGCNYLDIVPEDDIQSIETVFEQRLQVDKWVATCYRNVTSQSSITSNVAYAGADELVGNDIHRYTGDFAAGTMDGLRIGDGAQSVVSPISDSWSNTSYYATIRYCNTFFENIDKTLNMEQEEKELWIAEVKALKAHFYFELLKHYGPIVLVNENIDPNDDIENMQFSRRPGEECVDTIVSLLDQAMKVLPPFMQKDISHQGYHCLESAAKLKAQVLLYAASPLFNGKTSAISTILREPSGRRIV